MEHVRYHLVFQGFKAGTNKTEAGYLLKTEFKLPESRIADMMANRRCVLKSNLSKEEAVRLGRQLSQKGLMLKAEALATHQKSSPEELKKQLREGGLEQFFASRFRHPDDETDTVVSLLVLAAFPALTYIILPLIGLLLLLPLISIGTWSQQPFAASVQLVISLLLFTPAIILFPDRQQPEGLEVDAQTEELLYQLIQGLDAYLAAPAVRTIIFTNQPICAVRQSPKQWLMSQSTLVIGLPLMEALSLQQLIGLLILELSPLSKKLYQRTWGFYTLWRNALKRRNEHWVDVLDNWVSPIIRHQSERAESIAGQLIGPEQKSTLMETLKKFALLERDWTDFCDYCRQLNATPVWQRFNRVAPNTQGATDTPLTTLRFNAPALWVLSTTEGYQKAIRRNQPAAAFSIAAATLWQYFQHYIQHRELYFRLGVEPLSLMPTKAAKKESLGKNAHKLNQQAQKVLDCRYDKITVALGTSRETLSDLKAETLIWQQLSAPFWSTQVETNNLFPTARLIYQAIQLVLQMQQWLQTGPLPKQQQKQCNKQLTALQKQLSELCHKLPPMPNLGTKARSFADQLSGSNQLKIENSLSTEEISQNLTPWLNLLTVYWITVSGRLLVTKPD